MTSNPLAAGLDDLLPNLSIMYRHLHAHPELSGQEWQTARLAADWLRDRGWTVTEKVGGTGVVGMLRNGDGPTVLLRAELDGLPVRETTGLSYTSTRTGTVAGGRPVPVMHACGHDVHLTCLLGAAALLAANRAAWSGTVLAVCQPAEETGTGARAMVEDGLLTRFPHPDICLAQHVGPLPAGVFVTRPGPVMAAADTARIRLFGRGGHASTPDRTVDPVVLAAAVVMRLQTIVSREVGAQHAAVVTVGSLHAGNSPNTIPDVADLEVNVRSLLPAVRDTLLAAVSRIVHAEAAASNAPRAPEFETYQGFPLTVNDEATTARVVDALRADGHMVHDLPAPLLSSEDFGVFGTAAGCPSVFWHFGADESYTSDELAALPEAGIPERIPVNHCGDFAPTESALHTGTRALLAATIPWLGGRDGRAMNDALGTVRSVFRTEHSRHDVQISTKE